MRAEDLGQWSWERRRFAVAVLLSLSCIRRNLVGLIPMSTTQQTDVGFDQPINQSINQPD